MSLWRQERESGLILKYEWRFSQGYYPTRKPTPTYIQKAPGSSPIWGQDAGGFLTLSAIAGAVGLLCLGCFVAGEHRCGCGQFGAGHERGAEGGELACVAFGYAEQGQ